MAQLLHVRAGDLAGDPRRLCESCCRVLSAGGGAILPSSVIAALSVTSGRLVRMRFANPSLSFRASAARTPSTTSMPALRNLLESLAADQRIRVAHGTDHLANPRSNHGIGARPGAPLVRAWLEVEIERGAPGGVARLFKRQHLGVLHAVVGVEALAEDLRCAASATITAPTRGLGAASAMPLRASSRACAMKRSSRAEMQWTCALPGIRQRATPRSPCALKGRRSPAFSPTPT